MNIVHSLPRDRKTHGRSLDSTLADLVIFTPPDNGVKPAAP
jgi:hypothetical protein